MSLRLFAFVVAVTFFFSLFRYLELRWNLHLVDNTQPSLHDKLWKVRPLISAFHYNAARLWNATQDVVVDEVRLVFFFF